MLLKKKRWNIEKFKQSTYGYDLNEKPGVEGKSRPLTHKVKYVEEVYGALKS